MLGVGESRSPVFSPGSKEPRREAGPAAMGHPPWGSSMGFTLYLSTQNCLASWALGLPRGSVPRAAERPGISFDTFRLLRAYMSSSNHQDQRAIRDIL